MGSGCWTASNYASYCVSSGRSYNSRTRTIDNDYTNSSQAFTQNHLSKELDPKKVMRECCDSEEHPNTIPIILALDVTGSMGETAIKIQKRLNPIMERIYEEVKDAEIAIMAIGDLSCDESPIQISQFESDIRIAENLDRIYFENGGGGNSYESYTAAWYMGLRHCKLDCWNRGKKGIIITMGDEKLNPYLPKGALSRITGDSLQGNVETKDLYEEVSDKFNVYHICVESDSYPNQKSNLDSFKKYLNENVLVSSVGKIDETIINIIKGCSSDDDSPLVDEVKVTPMNTGDLVEWC